MSTDITQANTETEEDLIQEEEDKASSLGEQAAWVLLHTIIAIVSWAAMMVAITALKPDNVPVLITLAMSFMFPLIVGNFFTRYKQNDMGPYTWLIGLIWFLIICLWILDMPTGPNQCYHCDASQKIFLTFFSPLEDSGLIDNEGRMLGTWPAAAWIGYGIGSRLALKRKPA